MIEIRFHGRGGQGAVVASNILAEAAFSEGMHVSSFPFFGVERRGAPVTAYTRIDTKPIRIRSGIYKPDHIIVMDSTLLRAVDVLAGMKEGGIVLVNTHQKPEELGIDERFRVAVVDATKIALEHRLGSRAAPIVNSAVLGAYARVSGKVSIDAIVAAIKNTAPAKKEENAMAARDAHEQVVLR
ncbi:MAG: 2-oxoacid:acceptor oxidoreductase family protein [Candidatus Thermoplasmatota archaeon]